MTLNIVAVLGDLSSHEGFFFFVSSVFFYTRNQLVTLNIVAVLGDLSSHEGSRFPFVDEAVCFKQEIGR